MAKDEDDLRGSRVLVGLTCVDGSGEVLRQIQTHGVVSEVRDDALLLLRDDGSIFGLPPAPDLLDPAEPGVYELADTHESIENPDFLATLTITIRDPSSLDDLAAHGFMP